jgi:3-phenylpropionate/cinnamic acid dioxygenase small subunit
VTLAQEGQGVRCAIDSSLYATVCEWLIDEAELLDRNRFEEWTARLAPDLHYVMPVRESVHRADGDGIASGYAHFDENAASIHARVKRLTLDSAWAEDPPSRTRRFVTNVRARALGNGEVDTSSYLLVLRSRGDSPEFEFISCERRDILRPEGEGFLLAKREIVVDQAMLGVVNLALFL